MKIYYHGSSVDIESKYLEPRESSVINGEKAVFATNVPFISLVFIAGWSDLDFWFGSHNDVWYLIEQYPKAFDKIFKNVSGYIYQVNGALFKNDKRLGLQGSEFISRKKVPVLKKIYVKDVFEALKKTELRLVTHEHKMKAIEKYTK